MGADLAVLHGSLQRGIVPLGLIGIGDSKVCHCLVELIARAEIPAYRVLIASLRMGSGENPTTSLSIEGQQLGIESLHQRFYLGVAQLPNIELSMALGR